MDERDGASGRSPRIAAMIVAMVAVGAVAFWEWRKRAPLARRYRHAKRRSDDSGATRVPDPERAPGTDPV